MRTDPNRYNWMGPDDAELGHRFWFEWNPAAVASFIHKLNGVNRDGIDFPASLGQFEESPDGLKAFQYALLHLLTRTIPGMEITGVYGVASVAGEDFQSLCELSYRLGMLNDEPWVLAVLRHGEGLPGKLVKITLRERGELHDVIESGSALFH